MLFNTLNLFTLVPMLFCLNAFAEGGDHVGNGAGIAEQNVTYSWQVLSITINNCLADPECTKLAGAENLAKIKTLRAQIADDSIQFASAKLHPEYFALDRDGRSSIMTSQSKDLRAPIYINLDRLYIGVIPISIGTSSSLLMRTLGSKLDLRPDLVEDLQNAIERLFSAQAPEVSVVSFLSSGHPEFRLLLLSHAGNGPTHLVLDTGSELVDLDQTLEQQSPCLALAANTARLQLSETHFSAFTTLSREEKTWVLAEGNLKLDCVQPKDASTLSLTGSYSLSLPVQIKSNTRSGHETLTPKLSELKFLGADLH